MISFDFSMSSYQMKWDGGATDLHTQYLSDVSQQKWREWEFSLTSQPSILTTEMSMVPIQVRNKNFKVNFLSP